jgi:hypothetical protein
MNAVPAVIKNLDLVERRGYISYINPSGEMVTDAGWFMLSLDGRSVVRRKVGGRNRSVYCSLASVIAFDLYEEVASEMRAFIARERSK